MNLITGKHSHIQELDSVKLLRQQTRTGDSTAYFKCTLYQELLQGKQPDALWSDAKVKAITNLVVFFISGFLNAHNISNFCAR